MSNRVQIGAGKPGMPSQANSPQVRLSALQYFARVALVTAMIFAVFALLRPGLANALKVNLGLERTPPLAAESFYAVRVAPLLNEHCSACHGARRQKASLRLDSLAAILRGGKHGPVIRPGSVQGSVLAARIALPSTNERAMPPNGKPTLSADDATVIRLWIAAGASGVQPVGYFKEAPKPVARVTIAELDLAAVAKQRAPITSALQFLQARFPDAIAYESRGSANLELNASLLGRSFGDRELAAFAPLGGYIVRADLSDTAVSDASDAAIIAMKNLRVLRLLNTRVTDTTAAALASLNRLDSLTVIGTAVSDAALRPLRARGIRIYANHEAPGAADDGR